MRARCPPGSRARSTTQRSEYPMMIEARRDQKNTVFWLGLALCTLYLSYRYPLQINDSGTSPTYSDTPLFLQAGKFILALPLIALSVFRWITNSARLPKAPIALGALFVSCFALLKVLNSVDSQYLDFSFWLFFSLILVLGVGSIAISAIDKYFYLLLVFAFGSTLIEVLLFFLFGRLPALAFAAGLAARFGGFLDDPNGFAAVLFLLMGYSYMRFKGRTRFLVLAALVICLALTQSWTALAFFLAISFLWAFVTAMKRPLSAMIAICVLPFVGAFVLQLIPILQQGFLFEALQNKQASIEGHIFPWSEWISKWTQWALLGDWKYNAYESFWQAAVINFGLLWFAAYLVLIIALLIFMHRTFLKAPRQSRPVLAGLLLFGYYFIFGSFNLPFPIIFPINVLFFVFFFLVALGKVTTASPATESSRLVGSLAKATAE
jgi:hypothetical protein